MPTYSIAFPNGQEYEVESERELSDSEAYRYAVTQRRQSLQSEMDEAKKGGTSTLAQLPSREESEALYSDIAKGVAGNKDVQAFASGLNPANWPAIVNENVTAFREAIAPGTAQMMQQATENIGEGIGQAIEPFVPLADPEKRAGVAKGIGTSISGLAAGLPDALPLVAIGTVNPASGITVGASFAQDMLKSAGELWKRSNEAKSAGDEGKATSLRVQSILTGAMGLGIPAHTMPLKEVATKVRAGVDMLRESGKMRPEVEAALEGAQIDVATDLSLPRGFDSQVERVMNKAETSGLSESAKALEEVGKPAEVESPVEPAEPALPKEPNVQVVNASDSPAPQVESTPAPPSDVPTGTITEHADKITLSNLRIPEEMQGKGEGTKIVQQAISKADETGKPLELTAFADTPEQQPSLNKFYLDNGLEFVGNDPNGKPVFRYEPKPKEAEVSPEATAEPTPVAAEPTATPPQVAPEPPKPAKKTPEYKLPPPPKNTIPFGRINDLLSRPDANLIAVKPGKGATDDYIVKRYTSRKALETFLRKPGNWYALVKNEVDPRMVVNPAFEKAKPQQKPTETQPSPTPTAPAELAKSASSEVGGDVKPPVTPTVQKAADKIESQVVKTAVTSGKADAVKVKKTLVSELEAALKNAPSESDFGDFSSDKKQIERGRKIGAAWVYEAEKGLASSFEKAGIKRITIDIPGDGTFTIWNTKEAIGELLQKAKRLQTSMEPPKGFTQKTLPTREEGRKAMEESRVNPPEKPSEPSPVGMGGAVSGEFEKSARTATGTKIAAINEQRLARGQEPLQDVAGRSFSKETWQKTLAEIDDNPEIPKNLVDELERNPRPLSDRDVAKLLYRESSLEYERGRITRELEQAVNDSAKYPNRAVDAEELRAQAKQLANDLFRMEEIIRQSSSETGRGLAALRHMVGDNYTLQALEFRRKAARGGEELTPSERAELQKIAEGYKKAADAAEKRAAEFEKKASEEEAARVLAELKLKETPQEPKVNPYIISVAEKIVAGLDKRAMLARERLRGRLGRMSAGLDPTILVDLAEIGASHLGHIGLDFAKWSAKLVDEFGDVVKPHLKEIFEASKKLVEEPIAKQPERNRDAVRSQVVKGEKVEVLDRIKGNLEKKLNAGQLGEITGQVHKLAKYFITQGIKERDALIDAVHKVLSGIDPSITRRDAMDAISGYGKFKLLSKDEVDVRLRDLKGQMQQIAKLEDMADGKAPLKTGVQRRIPSDVESALIKEVNEAKKKGGYNVLDPESQLRSALHAWKKRTENAIKDFQQRIQEGNFAKRKRRTLNMDAESMRLSGEREKWKNEFQRLLKADEYKRMSKIGKAWHGFKETLNLSRTLMTSFDLSAVLRQGGMLTLSHPAKAASAFKAMLQSGMSDARARQIEQEILHRPNAPLYQKSKLYLAPHEALSLSSMEEAFMSRLAKKIPGVGFSQRTYITFLNRLRADSFDAMVGTLQRRGGELSESELKAIATFINESTGRGDMGKHAAASEALATTFFSPRLVLSRLQLLVGHPLWRGSARTRALVASEYARYLAAIGTIYALSSYGGASVETDPRSSEFGKIKIGNTRIDLLSGLAQNTVLLSRLATGEKKDSKGRIVPIRGDKVPYGGTNSADLIARFLRTKLSPWVGGAIDMLTGRTVVGEKSTPTDVLQRSVVPLSFSDIYNVMKEQGIEAGTAIALLSILGAGVQNYDEKQKRK